MMPISLGDIGVEYIVKKISGTPQVKQHLADLGFVVGAKAMIVSQNNGNLIVNIKEARVALGKDMAMKIMV